MNPLVYKGELTMGRVTKEYLNRIRKIWKSELNSYYKVTAHNTFEVPLITPTIGLLDWARDEIDQLDVKTRKVLTMTGSMHTNSDINRLYLTRKKGGRGLQCIADIFDTRQVHLAQLVEDEKE